MSITIHNRHGDFTREATPKAPKGKIHIYGGGTSGYKLSVGERHLTLDELVYIANLYNATIND